MIIGNGFSTFWSQSIFALTSFAIFNKVFKVWGVWFWGSKCSKKFRYDESKNFWMFFKPVVFMTRHSAFVNSGVISLIALPSSKKLWVKLFVNTSGISYSLVLNICSANFHSGVKWSISFIESAAVLHFDVEDGLLEVNHVLTGFNRLYKDVVWLFACLLWVGISNSVSSILPSSFSPNKDGVANDLCFMEAFRYLYSWIAFFYASANSLSQHLHRCFWFCGLPLFILYRIFISYYYILSIFSIPFIYLFDKKNNKVWQFNLCRLSLK